jgi:tripartite-type tricarboxylate transporter receptor subunit TctC
MDTLGRIVAKGLSDHFATPCFVENRGGAGGTIGAETVAKSLPDGQTLLLAGSNNLVVAALVRSDLPYSPQSDFAPISLVASVPYAVAVHSGVPARSLRDLISHAAAQPGKLTYGSSGNGSMSSLAMELLASAADVNIVHVPYKGSAPAVTDLLRGHIDVVITDLALLAPHAKAGSVRLLATTGNARMETAPDLPTVAEQGYPGYQVEPWYGIVAPAATPASILARLNSAVALALESAEARARFRELGYKPLGGKPEDLANAIRTDSRRYARVLKHSGTSAQ